MDAASGKEQQLTQHNTLPEFYCFVMFERTKNEKVGDEAKKRESLHCSRRNGQDAKRVDGRTRMCHAIPILCIL